MANVKVGLPRVHMAGSDAHFDAHVEVGQHGLAIFLSPEAQSPLLDIDGTPAQLSAFVDALHAALAAQASPHLNVSKSCE